MLPTSVKEAALNEFSFAFGEVLALLDEDGTDTFYNYFKSEFLNGVEYGFNNPDESNEGYEAEAALRYVLNPSGNVALMEPETLEATGKGSGLVFLYGAHWGKALKLQAK